jgi:hypothetical protein
MNSKPSPAEVILRLMVSQPVCLGIGHSPGVNNQNFISVRYLQFSPCGAPSLTRGWVLNLLVICTIAIEPQCCHSLVQVP